VTLLSLSQALWDVTSGWFNWCEHPRFGNKPVSDIPWGENLREGQDAVGYKTYVGEVAARNEVAKEAAARDAAVQVRIDAGEDVDEVEADIPNVSYQFKEPMINVLEGQRGAVKETVIITPIRGLRSKPLISHHPDYQPVWVGEDGVPTTNWVADSGLKRKFDGGEIPGYDTPDIDDTQLYVHQLRHVYKISKSSALHILALF
jgi:hypothetical protein